MNPNPLLGDVVDYRLLGSFVCELGRVELHRTTQAPHRAPGALEPEPVVTTWASFEGSTEGPEVGAVVAHRALQGETDARAEVVARLVALRRERAFAHGLEAGAAANPGPVADALREQAARDHEAATPKPIEIRRPEVPGAVFRPGVDAVECGCGFVVDLEGGELEGWEIAPEYGPPFAGMARVRLTCPSCGRSTAFEAPLVLELEGRRP